MFFASPEFILSPALAFIRVGAVLFALPVFGDNPTPVRVRILLAVAITAIIQPMLPPSWNINFNMDVVMFTALVAREVLVGLVLGFITRMVYDGLIYASGLVAYQMGFGTSSLFVPTADGTMDSFSVFHRGLVMLIFLGLNLHHLALKGIVETFQVIGPGVAYPNESLAPIIINTTSAFFTAAVQVAAPVLVALLFATAALGLMARTVPQLNVFTMSFPVNFFVGLLIYIATLPFYPGWIESHFTDGQLGMSAAIRSLVK